MDDDPGFPDSHDIPELEADADPTARGIVQCLRMLAEEAAVLRMERTLEALRMAIKVCAAEGDAAECLADGEDLRLRVAGSSRVH
jgi:hypothetical protein